MTPDYVARPPYFLSADRPRGNLTDSKSLLWSIEIAPDFQWRLTAKSRSNPESSASALIGLSDMPDLISLKGAPLGRNGTPLVVTPAELFGCISQGYDFNSVAPPSSVRPRVAFTVMAGSQRGGGTIQLYRYANWLVDLGFDVTVYSNDMREPTWAHLRCRYLSIPDDVERYQAIAEDLVIVYSILELPPFLQARNRANQRIVHFCQGLEEFHFGGTFNQVLAAKPIFQFLNALPVGRIVVSSALREYFARGYRQSTFFIQNGIEDIFRQAGEVPPEKRNLGANGNPLRIVHVANPGSFMKGTEVTLEAAALLTTRYKSRGLNVHVDFLSGPHPQDCHLGKVLPIGCSYAIKSGLSSEQMLAEYRSCDVVVNGSFHEGFGLSTVEALSSGALVVQADNFGLDGVVADGRNALVVPRNNVVALATAIGSLIEYPNLRTALCRNGPLLGELFSMARQRRTFVDAFSAMTGVSLRIEALESGSPPPKATPALEVREPPRFSVLVPVYNHARFLPTTLATLCAQSYPNWEAIVVNDGSTDHSGEIIEEFSRRDRRFIAVHKDNGGAASALNAALARASNDWICWLSSDDFFKPEKLAIHARYIEAFPSFRFFHSNYSEYYDSTGVEVPHENPTHLINLPPAFQTLEFFRWNFVHGNTIAIHRELFDRVGHFRSDYPNAQDYDMWLRMSCHSPFFFINQVTCTTRIHPMMGTAQSPEAGILDSFRSALDFVNKHSFEELCPFASLDDMLALQFVVLRCSDISLNPHAFLFKGASGGRSPLLERLYESLSLARYRKHEREIALGALVAILNRFQDLECKSPQLVSHFELFNRGFESGYQYKPIDPLQEMVRAYSLALRARDMNRVTTLREYFTKIRKNGVAGAPDIDSLFPGARGDGFATTR